MLYFSLPRGVSSYLLSLSIHPSTVVALFECQGSHMSLSVLHKSLLAKYTKCIQYTCIHQNMVLEC